MLSLLIFIAHGAFCSAGFVNRINDGFPPTEYTDIFARIQEHCVNVSKVKLDEIKTFMNTDDFDHLPNSPELKHFMMCLFSENDWMNSETGVVNVMIIHEWAAGLPDSALKIALGLAKGCNKKIEKIRDPKEKSYTFHVCMKKNDPQHYYLYTF